MEKTSLEELKERAFLRYEAIKAGKRERYAYARHLGFSSSEAQVLAGWSKKKIRELAKQNNKA